MKFPPHVSDRAHAQANGAPRVGHQLDLGGTETVPRKTQEVRPRVAEDRIEVVVDRTAGNPMPRLRLGWATRVCSPLMSADNAIYTETELDE